MIKATKLRKVGNSLVITVPSQEVARLHLRVGDLVHAEITRVELTRGLRAEIRDAIDRVMDQVRPTLEHLKDR